MKSARCKTLVRSEMSKLGIHEMTVELDEVELFENLSEDKLQLFANGLRNTGLELVEDKNTQLIKKIKAAVYQLVYLTDDLPKPNYSDYISQKVDLGYTHLSIIFSEKQGITLEKYIIEQRIDRIKEMLTHTELSLSDIAFKLHYSSVAHLSNQFKKLTGVNPSFYKKLGKVADNHI